MARSLVFFSVCFFYLGSVNAFIVPSTTFVAPSRSRPAQPIGQQNMLPPFLLADEQFEKAVESFEAAGASGSPILDTIKSIGLAITAILFLGVGLTYLTASVLIPQAAEQLEKETKRLRPDLWDEYQRKLEPGENISMRPDLLKELGDIMQPIIIADMEAQAGQIEKENDDLLIKLDYDENELGNAGAVDAEIVDESIGAPKNDK